MKLPDLRGRKWNYLAISFAMPFFFFLVLMIVVQAAPFGGKSLLYSDNFHQYFPFFKAFRAALLRGESLLYSWDVGMGMDYLGLISYYLASPLNLLSVLVPESWVLPYFSLLTPIKLGLASLFFAVFLKKIFQRDDFSIAIFGSFYGLCAWALGYQWNVMWLDTFALLPLVALGTVSLLRDKKFVLYTVTLALSILSNYYIGFFTCIFVLLLFICYQICRCKSIGRFFLDFVRIGVFTILAIGMTAILELPALAALGNTYSSVNSFPDGFSLNIVGYAQCNEARNAWLAFEQAKEAGGATIALWLNAIWESLGPVLSGMAQVAGNLAGGSVPTFKEGLPNIYCGLGTLIFSFLFLTAKQVKLRDKLCSVFLLLFLLASFVIRQLDYIWHGFHFTNMIPYRFSFLYSFVMLYMAYRAYLIRDRFKLWQIVLAGILSLEIILLSKYTNAVPAALSALGAVFQNLGQVIATALAGDKEGNQAAVNAVTSLYATHGSAYAFLVYNLVYFVMYIVILVYPAFQKAKLHESSQLDMRKLVRIRASRRVMATNLLALVMVLELVMNVVNFGVNFSYTTVTNYPNGTPYAESMIRYMKEQEDSLFYRVETTHSQTLNDGALNGYHGISTFTSSANVKVTDFMKGLGYAAQNNWNRYCFEESSPVANLFLNLKYMLERDGNIELNPYFENVHYYGDVYLLENKAYLPLGFLAESSLSTVQLRRSGTNAFAIQNHLFRNATGLDASVWEETPGSWLQIEGKNVTIKGQYPNGFCSYVAESGSGTLIYRYTVEKEGFLCLDVDMGARNSFNVSLNKLHLYSESVTLPQTFAVSQVKPGDVVELRASCASGEDSTMSVKAAVLNDEVFRTGYDILNASTLQLTEFSTTKVAGTINCNRDGLLYTSIPDDGNWKVKVDGEEAEIVLVGGAMIGLNLAQGDHEIVFTYENRAFDLGWKISLGCLLVFLALVYWKNRVWCHETIAKLSAKLKKK